MAKERQHFDSHLMFERLTKIHTKIKSGCYPNSKQLAFDNEVSIATISRDIEFLRDRLGADIKYDAFHRGYYYETDFNMSMNLISSKDVLSLSLAKQLITQYEGTPVYNDISSIIDLIVDLQGMGISDFLKRVAVPPLPKVVVNKETWNSVIECMKENVLIEFDYNGRWRTETTHRMLRPYQVLLQDGMYFVFGYDENANDGKGGERLFNLSRMKNLKATKKGFELPENFDFSTRCGGGKFGAFMSTGAEKFTVDFYGDARLFVKDCIWADNQKIVDYNEEEKTRIEFSSTQWLKILEWVLSQGQNAVPVGPEWFVDEWKEQVHSMAVNAGLL